MRRCPTKHFSADVSSSRRPGALGCPDAALSGARRRTRQRAPFPSSDQNKNGAGTAAGLLHVGGDIGESYAWRAGVSYLGTSATDRTYSDIDSRGNPVTNSFNGSTRVWIADAILKWAPNGNATITNFKLQGEYFRVRESGSLTFNDAGAVFGALADTFTTAQSGWYTQGVYQLSRWRSGLPLRRTAQRDSDNRHRE